MDYFKRYLANRFTRNDLGQLTQALKSKELSQEVDEAMKNHWNSLNDEVVDDVDFDHILSKVHHQINIGESMVENNRSVIRIWAKFGRIAAILMLPLLTTGIWVAYHYAQGKDSLLSFKVVAAKGQQSQVILSDGSEVWLNSESSIEYSANFGKENRDLKLMGEGYFIVAKNKKLPFVVRTTEMSVTAVGTVFNVDASSSTTKVTLEEGKVRVCKGSKAMLLNAGEQLIDKNGRLDVSAVDTELYTSWHEGVLIFKNELLSEITIQLEKKYDVHFEFADESLKNFRYRGRLRLDYSILKSLEILKISTGLNYEIKGRNIILRK